MEAEAILELLRRHNVSHDKIAGAIGKDRTVATKMMSGTRRMQASEMPVLAALALHEGRSAGDGSMSDPDEMISPPNYVPVEVLPTFAGMGGGGTGEGDQAVALLPRSLVEDELRAKASDLLIINVRGNSMEPLFFHGDQIVIDRRDQNPVQPGPFALWFDDGYVVKNVERNRKTKKYRIFSTNPAYSDDEADPEDVKIMGRPVWFARRL